MELYINGIAHYVPQERVYNSYFKAVNGLDDEWIYSRTGIRSRSKAAAHENTNTMAVAAVKNLQEQLPFPLQEVDLIIAATYSPYDTVMTAAHTLQREFNIHDARCLSVSSACSSFINALEIAEAYFGINKCRKALIVASEHNTAYSNDSCSQSGHLWGDGAIAVVISPTHHQQGDARLLGIHSRGLGDVGKANIAVHLKPQNGGILMPEGRDVFVNACHYMIESLNVVLGEQNKEIHDLAFISPHQANQRIINAIARQLDYPEERILSNIEEMGNTGCPSCAIALSQNRHRIQSGDLVALTVFGGGYSCGAVLMEF